MSRSKVKDGKKKWDSSGYYLSRDVFEIDDSWSYGNYNPAPEEIITKAEMHSGIPFVPLTEVLKWKLAFGRDKDMNDIEIIKEYMDKTG